MYPMLSTPPGVLSHIFEDWLQTQDYKTQIAWHELYQSTSFRFELFQALESMVSFFTYILALSKEAPPVDCFFSHHPRLIFMQTQMLKQAALPSSPFMIHLSSSSLQQDFKKRIDYALLYAPTVPSQYL